MSRLPMVCLLPILAGVAWTATRAPAPQVQDPAQRIKALKVEERLAAIDAIRHDGHKDAEKLLIDALDDRDWEVCERAAYTLGERGTAAGSVGPLSNLTVDGPVRRVRLAAVKAMAKLDAKAAAEHLLKSAKGATLQRACEGLAALGDLAAAGGDVGRSAIDGGLKSKDEAVRVAAAGGLHAFPAAERGERLLELLKDSNLMVGAAALESARLHPDPALLPVLLGILSQRDLHDVFERRVLNALVALLATAQKEARAELATKYLTAAKAASDPAAARLARLLGLIAAKTSDPPLIAPDELFKALGPMASGGSEAAVGAAVHALAKLATDPAISKLAWAANNITSPRVRSIALRDIQANGRSNPATISAIKNALADRDVVVREDAVVALGHPGIAGAAESLIPLLKDPEWTVAVAAAVSLGKTRDPAALAPLQQMVATKDKDWKRRDGALIGLGHLKQKEAVPLLIDLLDSKDATAKLSAYEFLRRMTNEKVAAREGSWKAWWQKNEQAFKFPDSDDTAKLQKYGYAPTTYGVYEDLDVIVFQSRGDHIEKMLDKLKIIHRLARQGTVPEEGVAPWGVYVANCTGECSAEDLEQVQWFVHTGGYLFSSCWALTYHSQEVQAGLVHGIDLSHERDVVTAEPCRESPYLDGVFEGGTRPKYVLDGPHLIQVLDPERVEVLIDSPECATRHQYGSLAAWWTAGHGLILDSVNHFDLQGFERAPQMKEPAERKAYAVDTMGLSYADLRDIPLKIWDSQSKAAEEVRDFSAFRFLTNFVRAKRRAGS